jgi:2-dehydro-3-deoxyphosphogluconate aldolase / (4S)-4-hydroxy-2-oxoglutarate aldolase
MEKIVVRGWIEEFGLIPAVRVHSSEDALFAAQALARSGIRILEIPSSTANGAKIIADLARGDSEIIVGAGSVWDKETAQRCLKAGASFLTSESFDREVAEIAREMDTIYIPGAMSFSEVNAAWAVCSHFIKVVPCSHIGGPVYIRELRSAFPDVPLIAAGGVTQQTAQQFIVAGAATLGIGEAIVPKEALRRRNADWIGELARRFIAIVKSARIEIETQKVRTVIARR